MLNQQKSFVKTCVRVLTKVADELESLSYCVTEGAPWRTSVSPVCSENSFAHELNHRIATKQHAA